MGIQIYVPGRGNIDMEAWKVSKAVTEYDERLYFDFNVETQQWCVYIKTPHGEPNVAVLGFERGIPHPDDALKRLHYANTKIHGEQILDRMDAHNEALKEPQRRAADNASGEAAEVLEYGFRKQGAHPVPRAFIPKDVP